jgi:flagellar capping protein FliD
MILQQEKGYDQQNTDLTGQINNLTQRNAVRQSALNAKLQAADALVAQLQSQQSLLTASLQALNYSLYGYQNGPSSPTSSKNSTTG